MVRNLYIHVPFCSQKCEYCAFYSHQASGEAVRRYLSALINELSLTAPGLCPSTIFFGGGTPSMLTVKQWEQLLRAMDQLRLIPALEWTVESNPATISFEKAKLLRSFGVNRISLGVQSLDEGLLDRLGRVHNRATVFKSFDILRSAGFDNINLDLMFAIPGQTMRMWRQTLFETLAMGCEHLSCYEVIYEQDTPLFAQLHAGRFDVDENLACDMYEQLVELAAGHGFEQYEIANFARGQATGFGGLPDRSCQHNVNYWRGGSFAGLGPSATSYIGGHRSRNWSNTDLYCQALEGGRRATEFEERLSPLARAGETAAFGLRMNAGWPFHEFLEVTGCDLRVDWADELKQLVEQGWARMSAERFQLTRTGLRFADSVAERFIRLEGAEATGSGTGTSGAETRDLAVARPAFL
jgi:oxygen-independent coproporphyrinogen III oxidase